MERKKKSFMGLCLEMRNGSRDEEVEQEESFGQVQYCKLKWNKKDGK